jgi:hypothetical protein
MPDYRDPPPPESFFAKQGRFPLPAFKRDPLGLSPNAEPLDFFMAIMRDKSQPLARRIEAATLAAPYRHIRLDSEFCRHLSKAQLDQIKNARVIEHKRS